MSSTGARVPSSSVFAPNQQDAELGPCAACAARQLAFCSVVEEKDLSRLLEILTEVHSEEEHAIFFEGDDARDVFNVTEGVVRVSKMLPDGRRQVTGFLFPGDFLGLSHDEAYAYTAEAITPARLCRFRRDKLLALFEELPQLERRLLGMAADELAVAQDQILLLGRKTARERVVSFLKHVSKQARKRGETGNPIYLPMSRMDIADYLGLTIETVSRTITKLTKDGVIELPTSSKVLLKDIDALDRIDSGEEA